MLAGSASTTPDSLSSGDNLLFSVVALTKVTLAERKTYVNSSKPLGTPPNAQVQERGAALSHSVPCNAVLGPMTLPGLGWRRSSAHELPNAVIEVGAIN